VHLHPGFDGGDGFLRERPLGGGGRGPDAVGQVVVEGLDEGAFVLAVVFEAGSAGSGLGRIGAGEEGSLLARGC